MGQGICFQVNQHKALEDVIVKHQINKETLPVQSKPFLAGDEGKAAAQFQEKLLEVINKGLLQITLVDMGIRLNLKEFHDIGILDDLLVLRLGFSALNLRSDGRLVLAGQDPLVIHGVDLALQLTHTPGRFGTLLRIECACLLV